MFEYQIIFDRFRFPESFGKILGMLGERSPNREHYIYVKKPLLAKQQRVLGTKSKT